MKSKRKGIILAGGSGTRLHPITKSISKQLIPIYDKPMIYYPLSTLMMANIDNVLVISSPEHIELYKILLGNGARLGMRIEYKIQEAPRGLAEAFILGEDFIGDSPVALILGDNLFYGHDFSKILASADSIHNKSTIFAYRVANPKRFGVVEFDKNGDVLSIEEKPEFPESPYAITGLYFYDNDVIQIAKSISPSNRGEIEITDVNKIYLKKDKLRVEILKKGFAWLDTGTPESLMQASHYIYTLDKIQGVKVLCPEEIAYKNKWIDKNHLLDLANENDNSYNQYLKSLL
jgi:glucose-1-phosphate thymidylyltransferase